MQVELSIEEVEKITSVWFRQSGRKFIGGARTYAPLLARKRRMGRHHSMFALGKCRARLRYSAKPLSPRQWLTLGGVRVRETAIKPRGGRNLYRFSRSRAVDPAGSEQKNDNAGDDAAKIRDAAARVFKKTFETIAMGSRTSAHEAEKWGNIRRPTQFR